MNNILAHVSYAISYASSYAYDALLNLSLESNYRKAEWKLCSTGLGIGEARY